MLASNKFDDDWKASLFVGAGNQQADFDKLCKEAGRYLSEGKMSEAVDKVHELVTQFKPAVTQWVVASQIVQPRIEVRPEYLLLSEMLAHLGYPAAPEEVLILLDTYRLGATSHVPTLLAMSDVHASRGELAIAEEKLREALRHHNNCMLAEQKLFDLAKRRSEEEGAVYVSEGVATYDFSDRFCSAPFDSINFGPEGWIWLCCPAFLPAPGGNVYAAADEGWEAIWNSPIAQEIRRSILDGDYTYCSKIQCPSLLSRSLPTKAEVIDKRHRDIIDNKKTKLDSGPTEVILSHDKSCNLACPMCRKSIIMANKAELERLDRIKEEIIDPMLDYSTSQKTIVHMTGDGDVFASKHYQSILESLDPVKHKNITLRILTNGLLFIRSWKKFTNIHELTKIVSVSVDAGSADVYREVRGGNWDTLVDNLEFIGELRRQNVIEQFGIVFAVQECNFLDMQKIVELAKRIGVDTVGFHKLRNGGMYEGTDYMARKIFDPDHPMFNEFLLELSNPIFNSPTIRFNSLQPLYELALERHGQMAVGA